MSYYMKTLRENLTDDHSITVTNDEEWLLSTNFTTFFGPLKEVGTEELVKHEDWDTFVFMCLEHFGAI